MMPMDLGLFDVEAWITAAGAWGLVLVCAIVFVETGLLIGFLLPGDTLLLITGILTFTGVIPQPIWLVVLCIFIAAVLGDQLGYYIGYKAGPPIFERKSAGFFSKKSVARTEYFFARYGGWAVTIARFIGVVRTIAPVAAGVGKMPYKKFLFFNILGAFLWGVGLTFIGWWAAHIPGVAEIVTEYIEIVFLSVIGMAVIGIGWHLGREQWEKRKEAKAAAAGEPVPEIEIWTAEPEHDGRHEAEHPKATYGVGPHDGKHEKKPSAS